MAFPSEQKRRAEWPPPRMGTNNRSSRPPVLRPPSASTHNEARDGRTCRHYGRKWANIPKMGQIEGSGHLARKVQK